MERDELTAFALRVANALPAVVQGQPFGEGIEVFKVVGKVFALVNMGEGRALVTLKCAPPHARALVERHPSIIPGYHMNKQHWISLLAGDDGAGDAGNGAEGAGEAVDATTVEDLIGNSYDLVVATLPRDRRPSAAG